MAAIGVQISALPSGTTATGTEVGPFVQGGATVKLTSAQIVSTANITAALGFTPTNGFAGNVNSYVNIGDTSYDGAIARAFAAAGIAYLPAKSINTWSSTVYNTTGTVTIANGQALIGDGQGISNLVCSSAGTPVVTLGPSISWFAISGLSISHSGTPTVGGDGIYQPQNNAWATAANTNWINDGLIINVVLTQNWQAANLGVAFYCDVINVQTNNNKADGIHIVTSGHSAGYSVTDTAGQVQWVFQNVTTGSNGPSTFSTSATATINTTAVTIGSNPSGIVVAGMLVNGYGIQSGTTVSSVTGTAVTLSKQVKSTLSGSSINFTAGAAGLGDGFSYSIGSNITASAGASGTNTITVPTAVAATLVTNQTVYGVNIGTQTNGLPTYITAINAGTGVITLHDNNTGAVTGQTVFFSVAGGLGISVGSLYNCGSYANAHHGFAAYGNPVCPINTVRIDGGFWGQDFGNGIYLDTYARDHVVAPTCVELTGQYGICISPNNSGVVVAAKQVFACMWDGLFNQGDSTTVPLGNYRNNGLAGTGVDNWAGINHAGGSITVGPVNTGNFNAQFQQYGIRASYDTINVTGAHLPTPSSNGAPATNINGVTTSGIVGGALISAANVGNVLGGIYIAPLAVLSESGVSHTTTTLDGLASTTGLLAGDIISKSDVPVGTTIVSIGAGSVVMSAAATGSSTSTVAFTRNPVNSIVSGCYPTSVNTVSSSGTITGNLNVTGSITAGTDITSSGTLHVTGASAFTGGIILNAGCQIGQSGGSSGIVLDNATFNKSLGVGVATSGVVGRIDATTVVATGQMTMQDAYVTRSMGLAATPDASIGHFVCYSGGIAFQGGINVTSTITSLSVVTCTSVSASYGISIGSPTGGIIPGVLNAATDVRVNNTSVGISGGVYTGNLTVTGSMSVASLSSSGAISGTTGSFSSAVTSSVSFSAPALYATGGGISVTGGGITIATGVGGLSVDYISCSKAIAVGAVGLPAVGVINVQTAIALNGVVYTNP